MGEEVLVLLPTRQNRLRLECLGPYRVVRRVTVVDYEVQTPGRCQQRRTYNINLMKWHPLERGLRIVCLAVDPNKVECAIDQENEDGPMDELDAKGGSYPVGDGPSEIDLAGLAPGLSEEQLGQLQTLLEEYVSVSQASPG